MGRLVWATWFSCALSYNAGIAVIMDDRALHSASARDLQTMFGYLSTIKPLLPEGAVCGSFISKDKQHSYSHKLQPHIGKNVCLGLPKEWCSQYEDVVPTVVRTAVKVSVGPVFISFY
jgi:hypothetical protein